MAVQLSQQLQRLTSPRSALDIIRFLGARPDHLALSFDIIDGLDITERSFKKAIRRLVTTGYVNMVADQEYRLTDQGVYAAEELAEYDRQSPAETDETPVGKIDRRLLLALPRMLVANQTTHLLLGLHPDQQKRLSQSVDMVLRVTAINARLGDRGDVMLKLDNQAVQEAIPIRAGRQSQVRVRVQAFQLAPNGEDINHCGGMYIDVDVTGRGGETGLVAYGTNIYLDDPAG